MSTTEQPGFPEMDARSAAFAPRKKTFPILEWGGHRYEIRPPSLSFQEKMENSKESKTRSGIRTIIECTYWPPETSPDEKGKTRAGTRMFSERDVSLMLESYGDPDSLWLAIIRKVGESQKAVADMEKAVGAEVGNSVASPSSSIS